MALFVDSADIREVKRAMQLGFVYGVTTNPILIARTGKGARQVMAELGEICQGPIFHQVAAGSKEEMIAEARDFSHLLPHRLVVKVPCTLEGLRMVSEFKEILCAVTAICTPAQAYLACQAGARYLIPYVNRVSKAGANGLGLVKAMREVISGSPTEILAASLKSPEEVVAALQSGAHHVTVPLKVIEEMAESPLTREALAAFAAVEDSHS